MTYSNYDYAEQVRIDGISKITLEEFLKIGKDLQMKNESLKETLLVPGNVVVNRDGTAYIVVGDKIIREESYDNLGTLKRIYYINLMTTLIL